MALSNFFQRFLKRGNAPIAHAQMVYQVADDEASANNPFPQIDKTQSFGPMKATIIVVGNEKGGSGKSTTSMHIIVGLLNAGKTLATFDLDARQGSLSRYIENRKTFFKKHHVKLALPTHMPVQFDAIASDNVQARAHIRKSFEEHIQQLARTHDFVLIDTPGTDNYLSRLGHSYADILVTPINDSFIDLDVLAHVDSETLEIEELSHYAKMVIEERKEKKKRYGSNPRSDWLVMRNRLGQFRSRNQEAVGDVLQKIGKLADFSVFNGLSERVIYRELFLNGLTLLDIRESKDFTLSTSHMAARDELSNLLERLNVGVDLQLMMQPTQFKKETLPQSDQLLQDENIVEDSLGDEPTSLTNSSA